MRRCYALLIIQTYGNACRNNNSKMSRTENKYKTVIRHLDNIVVINYYLFVVVKSFGFIKS